MERARAKHGSDVESPVSRPGTNATWRNWTHASSVDDCAPCPEGYECVPGDPVPIPCPRGAYSPLGFDPIPCPRYTYNSDLAQYAEEHCRPCPAGAFCEYPGTAYHQQYPCPEGHYCLEKSDGPIECPGGYYQPELRATNQTACLGCPADSFCGPGSGIPVHCADPRGEIGYYCPKYSANRTICPAGQYCPAGDSYRGGFPFDCPAGYYCPQGSLAPKICPNGTYCPPMSGEYRWCPLGYKNRVDANNSRTSVADSCEVCPPGTHGADPKRLECAECLPGYVCLGETRSATPSDRWLDKGYECPAGSYCPAGSTIETQCAPGSSNPLTGSSNASACVLCNVDAYQDMAGQAYCKECSSTSKAVGLGNARCACVGLNRAFQSSGLCPCDPGYVWFDPVTFKSATTNDASDCQPEVYERCSDENMRDHLGQCTEEDDCSGQCGASGGDRDTQSGLCVCYGMQQLDEECDQACRDSSDTVSYDASLGSFVTTDANGTSVAVPTSDLDGYYGDVVCNTDDCEVQSMSVSSTSFAGNYGSGAALREARRRRRRLEALGVDPDSESLRRRRHLAEDARRRATSAHAWKTNETLADHSRRVLHEALLSTSRVLEDAEDDASISNPVVCVTLGSTILFDVSNAYYPTYESSSLLNSNADFDYSAFTSLAETASSSATVSSFAFTFTESGLYVFSMSAASDVLTLIKVMDEGTECSTEAAFTPMTSANLNAVGGKLSDDIVLDPDWEVLGGLLGGLSLMIFGVIGAIYYFRKQAWSIKSKKGARYRDRAKHADLDKHAKKGAVFRKGGEASDGPPLRPGAGGARDLDEDDEDLEDLDEEELARQLQRHHDLVEQEFFGQRELVRQLHEAVTHEADELKRLVAASLADHASPNKAKEALHMLLHGSTARRLHDGAAAGAEAEVFRLASQLAVLLEEGGDRMARRVVEEVREATEVALEERGAVPESDTLRRVRGEVDALVRVIHDQLVAGTDAELRRRQNYKAAFEAFAEAHGDVVLPVDVVEKIKTLDGFDDATDAAAHHLAEVLAEFEGRGGHFVAALAKRERRLAADLAPPLSEGATGVLACEQVKLGGVETFADLLDQLAAALRAIFGGFAGGDAAELRRNAAAAKRDEAEAARADLDAAVRAALDDLPQDAKLDEVQSQLRAILEKLSGQPGGATSDDIKNMMDELQKRPVGSPREAHHEIDDVHAIAEEHMKVLEQGLDERLGHEVGKTDLADGDQHIMEEAIAASKAEAAHMLEREKQLHSFRLAELGALEDLDEDAEAILAEKHAAESAALEERLAVAAAAAAAGDDGDGDDDDADEPDSPRGVEAPTDAAHKVSPEEVAEADARAVRAVHQRDLAALKSHLAEEAAHKKAALQRRLAELRAKRLAAGDAEAAVAADEDAETRALAAALADEEAREIAAAESEHAEHLTQLYEGESAAALEAAHAKEHATVSRQLDAQAERARADLETRIAPRRRGRKKRDVEDDLERKKKAALDALAANHGAEQTHMAASNALKDQLGASPAADAEAERHLAARKLHHDAAGERAGLDASLDAERRAKELALKARLAARRRAAELDKAHADAVADESERLADAARDRADADPDDVDLQLAAQAAELKAEQADAAATKARDALEALDDVDGNDEDALAAELAKSANAARAKLDGDLDAERRRRQAALRARLEAKKRAAENAARQAKLAADDAARGAAEHPDDESLRRMADDLKADAERAAADATAVGDVLAKLDDDEAAANLHGEDDLRSGAAALRDAQAEERAALEAKLLAEQERKQAALAARLDARRKRAEQDLAAAKARADAADAKAALAATDAEVWKGTDDEAAHLLELDEARQAAADARGDVAAAEAAVAGLGDDADDAERDLAAELRAARDREMARLDAALEAERRAKRDALKARLEARRKRAAEDAAAKREDLSHAKEAAAAGDGDAAADVAELERAVADAEDDVKALEKEIDGVDVDLAAMAAAREAEQTRLRERLEADRAAKKKALEARLAAKKQAAAEKQAAYAALVKDQADAEPGSPEEQALKDRAEVARHDVEATKAAVKGAEKALEAVDDGGLRERTAADTAELEARLDAERRAKRDGLRDRLAKRKRAADDAKAAAAALEKSASTPEEQARAAEAAADADDQVAAVAELEQELVEQEAVDLEAMRRARELEQQKLEDDLSNDRSKRKDALKARLEARRRQAELERANKEAKALAARQDADAAAEAGDPGAAEAVAKADALEQQAAEASAAVVAVEQEMAKADDDGGDDEARRRAEELRQLRDAELERVRKAMEDDHAGASSSLKARLEARRAKAKADAERKASDAADARERAELAKDTLEDHKGTEAEATLARAAASAEAEAKATSAAADHAAVALADQEKDDEEALRRQAEELARRRDEELRRLEARADAERARKKGALSARLSAKRKLAEMDAAAKADAAREASDRAKTARELADKSRGTPLEASTREQADMAEAYADAASDAASAAVEALEALAESEAVEEKNVDSDLLKSAAADAERVAAELAAERDRKKTALQAKLAARRKALEAKANESRDAAEAARALADEAEAGDPEELKALKQEAANAEARADMAEEALEHVEEIDEDDDDAAHDATGAGDDSKARARVLLARFRQLHLLPAPLRLETHHDNSIYCRLSRTTSAAAGTLI